MNRSWWTQKCNRTLLISKINIAEANINLRKWRSNNRGVNEFIEGKHKSIEELSEDRIYTWLMLDPNEEGENNVLAKPRNTKYDEFVISFWIQKSNKDVVTKSGLLKTIASIFHPVEILSPVVVLLKILFQKMCKEASSWGDDINDECKTIC